PSAGTEDAKHLREHTFLARGKADDAVRDDPVDRARLHGKALDETLAYLDVRKARVRHVPPCSLNHRIGHVDANAAAFGADLASGEDEVDARARTKIQHGVPRLHIGKGHGVSTAEELARSTVGQRGNIMGVIARQTEASGKTRC